MNLDFIDLDGVIIDSSERMKRATKEDGTIDWPLFFNPELFYLDEVMEEAKEHLKELMELQKGQFVAEYYLTSRPEHLRYITLRQLSIFGLPTGSHSLIMKPPAVKYEKTTIWKAGVVDTLSMMFASKQTIFIDDEEKNRQTALEHKDESRFSLLVYSSIKEAVEAMEKK